MLQTSSLTLIDASREFKESDLFFSTTDQRGVVTSCNEVFLNVAGYRPEEVLGKPHNVIRHPHMPRCVFKLFWDYLLAGNPIGAYVKNRAKSGEYYWVYALASPVTEGYLSVRIKPTTPFLDLVQKAYAELLAIEDSFGKDWKAGMAASTKALLAKLSSLGFESYDEFMSETLLAEMRAHKAAVAKTHGESIAKSFTTVLVDQDLPTPSRTLYAMLPKMTTLFNNLETLGTLRQSIVTEEKALHELEQQLTMLAINASVRSAHLSDVGRALSVVSSEISSISGLVSQEGVVLTALIPRLSQALRMTSFNIALASLQSEVIAYFKEEQGKLRLSREEQIVRYGKEVAALEALLVEAALGSIGKVNEGVLMLRQSLTDFKMVAESLGKILFTIQFSYITGKAIAATIAEGESFVMLLQSLVSLSDSERVRLDQINDTIEMVSANMADSQQAGATAS